MFIHMYIHTDSCMRLNISIYIYTYTYIHRSIRALIFRLFSLPPCRKMCPQEERTLVELGQPLVCGDLEELNFLKGILSKFLNHHV